MAIYSANSGKRPQSVVEVSGRRFQKSGGIQQAGTNLYNLQAAGSSQNYQSNKRRGGGSLAPGGSKKNERKGRGKSADRKNNKTVFLKNTKQFQAKNSLNTTDINQFNLIDMSKNIEQNIQKIQHI